VRKALEEATKLRTEILKKEEAKLAAEGVGSGGAIVGILGGLIGLGAAGGGGFWWYKNKGPGASGSQELQEN
jgi:hypothetical protein